MTQQNADLVHSRREVARQVGLTEGALRFAEKAGRIVQEPGGGYDVAHVRASLRNSADPARARDEPSSSVSIPPAATPARDGVQEPSAAPLRPTGMTFADARTAHEILKAQERRLRLDERRGRLVDKNRAMLLVHRLAKEERDAILAWPSRVAAMLAAELGVDPHRLQMVLDASLRDHLKERHDVHIAVA